MARKRQNCQEIDTFSRRRFGSLLSPSRDPSRVLLQLLLLLARLLATGVEAPEEEAGFGECNFSFSKNSQVQINFKLNEKNRMITY